MATWGKSYGRGTGFSDGDAIKQMAPSTTCVGPQLIQSISARPSYHIALDRLIRSHRCWTLTTRARPSSGSADFWSEGAATMRLTRWLAALDCTARIEIPRGLVRTAVSREASRSSPSQADSCGAP
nr:hypothetical protein CFP56_21146 [Quercus suber]